ncbi:hypothetical protein [Streptomyces sp. NPDC003952]
MHGPEETEEPAAPDTTAGSGATATTALDEASEEASEEADGEADGGRAGAEGEPDAREARDTRSRIAGRWRTPAVVAAVVLLLLGGSAFFYGAHRLRATPSAQNRALTDTVTTERVGGEISDGLARIFSYTPTGADATERSARTVLGGKAARQYTDLFAQLRANLETQKITLNTRAVRTGVIELDGDTARLLVLLDQTSRRDEGATTSAAAQLTVTARFQENRWQIVDIKTR